MVELELRFDPLNTKEMNGIWKFLEENSQQQWEI